MAPVLSEAPPSLRRALGTLKDLTRPDYRTNLAVIAREYAVLISVVVGCEAVRRYNEAHDGSLLPVVAVYFVTVMIIGGWVQNRLGVLLHEASHFSLFRGPALNDFAANLFLAYPLFGDVENYRRGHWSHHVYVNLGDRDPDLRRLKQHARLEYPLPPRDFWRGFVLAQVLPWKGLSYLAGRAQYIARLDPTIAPVGGVDAAAKGQLRRLALRLAFGAFLATLFTVEHLWWEVLAYWIVPLITFFPAVLFLREIVHHGNTPGHGPLENSRCYDVGWLARQVLLPFGEWNHALHHVLPSVPHHKMRAAHARLMQVPDYRQRLLWCNGLISRRRPAWAAPSVVEALTTTAGTAAPPFEIDSGDAFPD